MKYLNEEKDEKIVKDIIGNVLNIGDMVAFNPPYYKGLKTGMVTSFTPKGVRVDGYAIKTGVVKVLIPEMFGR